MSDYTWHRKEEETIVDSLEWSKKFEVLSISRLVLHEELGFTTEQVRQLTDEDMQRIADWLHEQHFMTAFADHARYITLNVFKEKGTDNRTGGRVE